jgi:hypothetical protein
MPNADAIPLCMGASTYAYPGHTQKTSALPKFCHNQDVKITYVNSGQCAHSLKQIGRRIEHLLNHLYLMT